MHNLTRHVHFDDHVATVQSYLNAYKAAQKSTQDEMSVIFWGYLTAACWKKLHHRMDHWATQGIMAFWVSLGAAELAGTVTNLCALPDPKLAELLCVLRTGGGLDSIMNYYPLKGSSIQYSQRLFLMFLVKCNTISDKVSMQNRVSTNLL